ncbi:MAG: hypothetical protein AAF292_17155 [Pseudomonadota bacterium]
MPASARFAAKFFTSSICVATGVSLPSKYRADGFSRVEATYGIPLSSKLAAYIEKWCREPAVDEPFDVPAALERRSLSDTANQNYRSGNLSAASGAAVLNYHLDRSARKSSFSGQIDSVCVALRYLRRSMHLCPSYVELVVTQILTDEIGPSLDRYPNLGARSKYALLGELLCWLNEHGDWAFAQNAYEALIFDGPDQFKQRAVLSDYEYSGFLRQAAHAFAHTTRGSPQSARIFDAAEAAHGSAQNYLGTASMRLVAAQAQADRSKQIAICEHFAERAGFNPLEELEPMKLVSAEIPTIVGFSSYVSLFLRDVLIGARKDGLVKILEIQSNLEDVMAVQSSLVLDYIGTMKSLRTQQSKDFATFFSKRLKRPLPENFVSVIKKSVYRVMELT